MDKDVLCPHIHVLTQQSHLPISPIYFIFQSCVVIGWEGPQQPPHVNGERADRTEVAEVKPRAKEVYGAR